MKPNDLRMGNLVYNRHNEVTEVDLSDLKQMCQPRMDGNGYSGIPLTSEWHPRLGFDMKGDPSIKLGSPDRVLFFVITNSGYYPHLYYSPEFSNEDPQVVGLNRIEYIHQLQNLYHALTGNELEVKP